MQISRGKVATPKSAARVLFGIAILGFLLSLYVVINGRSTETKEIDRSIKSHFNSPRR